MTISQLKNYVISEAGCSGTLRGKSDLCWWELKTITQVAGHNMGYMSGNSSKEGSTNIQDNCRMVICTSGCHTCELPAIFQFNIYLQSGHAKSMCQYNVDISIHWFLSDANFTKLEHALLLRCSLCLLITDSLQHSDIAAKRVTTPTP